MDNLYHAAKDDDKLPRDTWKRTMEVVAEAKGILDAVHQDASEERQNQTLRTLRGIVAQLSS